MLRLRKGQSVMEYALIISVVVGALIALQVYMKRSVQGRLKDASDQIGDQFDPASVKTAYKTVGDGVQSSTETRVHGSDGSTTTAITSEEAVKRTEHEEWGDVPEQHEFE